MMIDMIIDMIIDMMVDMIIDMMVDIIDYYEQMDGSPNGFLFGQYIIINIIGCQPI